MEGHWQMVLWWTDGIESYHLPECFIISFFFLLELNRFQKIRTQAISRRLYLFYLCGLRLLRPR